MNCLSVSSTTRVQSQGSFSDINTGCRARTSTLGPPQVVFPARRHCDLGLPLYDHPHRNQLEDRLDMPNSPPISLSSTSNKDPSLDNVTLMREVPLILVTVEKSFSDTDCLKRLPLLDCLLVPADPGIVGAAIPAMSLSWNVSILSSPFRTWFSMLGTTLGYLSWSTAHFMGTKRHLIKKELTQPGKSVPNLSNVSYPFQSVSTKCQQTAC